MYRRIRVVLPAVFLLFAAIAYADGVISHDAPPRFKGGETAILKVKTPNQDKLQCFYREVGAQDWSSVDAPNLGPKKTSSVSIAVPVLAKEIEYYFLTVRGHRVTATTQTSRPDPYRVHVVTPAWVRKIHAPV